MDDSNIVDTGDDVVWPWGMSDRDPDPSTRPWVFNPKGFLLVVLADDAEATKACATVLHAGVAENHRRMYSGRQVLEERAAYLAQQGLARRVVETITIDSEAVDLLVDYAEAGRAFLWVVAPGREDANRVIRALADLELLFVRYYGHQGVEDIRMT